MGNAIEESYTHSSCYVKGEKGNSVLINADDFGLNHAVNLAIIDLLRTNRIQRTTIMVNMPYVHEAYNMVKENNLLDKVGLHLNLTDGKPLSKEILKTRFCSNGEFDTKQVESGTRLFISNLERKAVEGEVMMQLNKFKEIFGYYPKHLDGHRHVHNYLPFLFIIIRLSKKIGVESMRIGINLFDYKTSSVLKKIYKLFINTIIKTKFQHTDYMGSYFEYRNYFQDSIDKTVEIMVHPIYYDGKIVDIIYDECDMQYYDFPK